MAPTTVPAVGRPSEALSRNQLLELFYYARLTRDVEERLAILYRQNKVVGGLYRSLGQEGESVAASCALALKAAIRDDAPVLFLEHKYLYRRLKEDVPHDDYIVPIGKAIVRRQGSDATIVTFGAMGRGSSTSTRR